MRRVREWAIDLAVLPRPAVVGSPFARTGICAIAGSNGDGLGGIVQRAIFKQDVRHFPCKRESRKKNTVRLPAPISVRYTF